MIYVTTDAIYNKSPADTRMICFFVRCSFGRTSFFMAKLLKINLLYGFTQSLKPLGKHFLGIAPSPVPVHTNPPELVQYLSLFLTILY